MAVELDTTMAIRGIAPLRALVEAIMGADDDDELDWVEWKLALDLTTKAGCFHVARAVLGMANRLPERAAPTCGGLGYIVVGAEPGSIEGVTSVDPAKLSQTVELYIGTSDGPRWSPTYVDVREKTVLVVTVETPKPGDRIFTVKKEFEGAKSGAVLVRKHGRTVPADAADLDALQVRLLAARLPGELEVSIVGEDPVSWVDSATAPMIIDAWVAEQRNGLVTAAQETERRRQEPKVKPSAAFGNIAANSIQALAQSVARQQAQMTSTIRAMGLLGEEDKRSLGEFIAEVDAWVQHLRAAARKVLMSRMVAAGHGVVAVEVVNPTGRFLSDVEVEVHFEGDHVVPVDDETAGIQRLPPPPRPYGERTPTGTFLSSNSLVNSRILESALRPAPPPRLRRTWVENGSVRVRFRVGDLRQQGVDRSGDVPILVSERPADVNIHHPR